MNYKCHYDVAQSDKHIGPCIGPVIWEITKEASAMYPKDTFLVCRVHKKCFYPNHGWIFTPINISIPPLVDPLNLESKLTRVVNAGC